MEDPMLLGANGIQKKKNYARVLLLTIAAVVGVAVVASAGFVAVASVSNADSEPAVQALAKTVVVDSTSVEDDSEEEGTVATLRGSSLSYTADEDLPILPAVDRGVGYGFDITTEDFKLPVVQFHYEEKDTYDDKDGGKKYLVPDELEVMANPRGHDEEEEQLFEHMHEYLEYKFNTWGVDVGLQYKMIEAKASFQRTKIHAESLFQQDTHYLLYGEKRAHYYDVNLWPTDNHPKFQKQIDMLPATFESPEDKDAYYRLISYFGTHFCDHAAMGGMVNWTVAYDKSISESHTMDWTQTELKLSVGVIKANLSIDGHSKWEHNETEIDKDFNEHSKRAADSLGGQVNVRELGSFADWLVTVPESPSPLPNKMRFKPLSYLIKDPAKKANMVNAIVAYANGELSPSMQSSSSVSMDAIVALTEQTASQELAPAQDDEDYEILEVNGVGYSFDAVTEDYRFPVFKYNYDLKQTFYDRIRKKTFLVPDELDVDGKTEMHEIKTQKEYEHMNYYFEEHTRNSYFGIGFDVGFFGLDFALSKSKGELHEYFKDDQYGMVYGDRSTVLYSVQAWPADLHPKIQKAVDALPDDYDEERYLDFVQSYGTHYAQQAKFGAAVNFTMMYDKSLWNKHDVEWTKSQCHIGIDVMGWDIGLNSGGEHERKHMDADFILHSRNVTDSEGGKVNVKLIGNYTEWLNTAVDNPTALSKYTKFYPIYDLIKEPAKKAGIKKAIMAYGAQGPRNLMESAPKTTAVAADVDPDTLPPLAGSDEVGCGFDVTTLERKHCITKLSYSHDPNCVDCVYSFPGYDGYDFKVPQEMIAQQTPESFVQNICLVMRDVADYAKTVVHSESHRHGFLGMGKKTKTTYDYYKTYYENMMARTLNFHYYSWYTLTMPTLPMPEMDPRFTQQVERLPAELNDSTRDEYMQFLQNFGTHVTTQAVMGGHINATTLYHKCFLGHYEEHWVSEQSGWSFAGIIGGGHGHTDGHKNVDEKFWEHQETQVDLVGGDPQFYKNITWWSEWVKTIKDNPVPVRRNVRPISDFIADPALRANLDLALGQYLQAAEDEAARLEEEFKKHDPMKEPAWCKPPAPPL